MVSIIHLDAKVAKNHHRSWGGAGDFNLGLHSTMNEASVVRTQIAS